MGAAVAAVARQGGADMLWCLAGRGLTTAHAKAAKLQPVTDLAGPGRERRDAQGSRARFAGRGHWSPATRQIGELFQAALMTSDKLPLLLRSTSILAGTSCAVAYGRSNTITMAMPRTVGSRPPVVSLMKGGS